MPLALLVRMLTRLAVLLGVGAFARRRRGAGRGSVPPPWRTPGTGTGGGGGGVPEGAGGRVPDGSMRDLLRVLAGRTWLGRRMPDVAAGARLAGFALALAAFGSVALVLVSAGTTLTTLGPRWLGIVLLVLAAGFGVAAVREAVWLRRAVMLRRRRRWVQRLDEPGGGGDAG